ncbi:lysoplasmalogenase [Planococcus halotolerans]|uniref:Lysoplasmalogenase n=1 Tax=Planococcus halotolerans TaxID=2233542 RepID=A0A365L0L7_9BACL|nr:lysoplasmalogenase [Planococcus halotolerans]RAZ78956.1 lysoplasmalogenase [Planococcus halotolerans]
MKKSFLPVLILAASILYIFFIPDEPLWFKLIFKLIPMVLIIMYAFLQMPGDKLKIHWLILTGLVFCSIGDATLHWFIIGLSAFLIGHLFYIAAFLTQWKYSLYRLLSILPLGIFGLVMGVRMLGALQASGDDALIVPVLFYIFAIILMAWSAFMTGNRWLIIGSLLFVASDSVLAWNMFVAPVAYSHLLIMSTYYSAQFSIAHSVASFRKPIIGNK